MFPEFYIFRNKLNRMYLWRGTQNNAQRALLSTNQRVTWTVLTNKRSVLKNHFEIKPDNSFSSQNIISRLDLT